MQLKELRELHEKSSIVVCQSADSTNFLGTMLLVVTKPEYSTIYSEIDEATEYDCLRYINVSDNHWEVTVDHRNVGAETALRWALEFAVVNQE